MTGQHRRVRFFGLAITVALAVGAVHAHNTNTTHPKITQAAIEVIESSDEAQTEPVRRSAYAELYRNARSAWGTDPEYDEAQAGAKLNLNHPDFQVQPFSVMDGVVLEDFPFTRVLTHFYNAYTGQGSTDFCCGDVNSSAVVGHRFFDQAIEAFGYELRPKFLPSSSPFSGSTRVSSAKELGLFLFGHSLHHVEDMSSIAHAHNDAHLTLFESLDNLFVNLGVEEVDDYEAGFIPTLLWDGNSDTKTFASQSGPFLKIFTETGGNILQPIAVDDFTDIWPVPQATGDLVLGPAGGLISDDAGLGRSVVNLTVFHGKLDDPTTIDGLGCAEDRASGELAEMFDRGSDTYCTIFFDYIVPSGIAGWRIEGAEIKVDNVNTPAPGIGFYFNHIVILNGIAESPSSLIRSPPGFFEAHKAGWWPLSSIGGPQPGSDPSSEYYYIEQLMNGIENGAGFQQRELVRPPGIRSILAQPYDSGSNPVIDNPVVPSSFDRKQPRSLLEMFADELVPLATRYAAGYAQFWYDIANLPPYLIGVEVEQSKSVRYSAEWIDLSTVRTITFFNEILAADIEESFHYVQKRNLSITTIKHIDPDKPFALLLTFNEPVQGISDEAIEIRLNDVVVPYSGLQAIPAVVADPWLENRQWLLLVENLDTVFPLGLPEGEVRLTVQAHDRNFHRDRVGGTPTFGAMLDQDPGTPARRMRLDPDREREAVTLPGAPWGLSSYGFYPWHYSGSIDVQFPGMKKGDFAYERIGDGDASHVLLFDATPPHATLGVQQ